MSRSRHSGRVSSVQRTRPEKHVLTVISWDTEKRVVGLDNPTFQVVAAGVEQGILLVVGLSLVRLFATATGASSVLDAEAISNVDLSAAQTVRRLLEELSGKGVSVVFGRVNPYLLADMRRHRIAELIGEGSPHVARGARRDPGRRRHLTRAKHSRNSQVRERPLANCIAVRAQPHRRKGSRCLLRNDPYTSPKEWS